MGNSAPIFTGQAMGSYRRTRRQCLCLLLSPLLLVLTGCPPTFYFEGRLLIMNATGEDMDELTLTYGGFDPSFGEPLGPTADGQAWIRLVAVNSIGFRWRTQDGVEMGASEPLEDHIPLNTRGDLMVTILGPGSLRIQRCDLAE
jgi:hypothetical protein